MTIIKLNCFSSYRYFLKVLYILDISDICFANILPCCVSFNSVNNILVRAEFLILKKSNSSLSFMDHAFGVASTISSPKPKPSMFIFKKFYSSLYLASMIHVELIFVRAIRSLCLDYYYYYYFAYEYPVLAPFIENTYLFFIELPLFRYQRSVDCIYISLFLGCLFCSLDLFVL